MWPSLITQLPLHSTMTKMKMLQWGGDYNGGSDSIVGTAVGGDEPREMNNRGGAGGHGGGGGGVDEGEQETQVQDECQ